jgi:hypothetical protein
MPGDSAHMRCLLFHRGSCLVVYDSPSFDRQENMGQTTKVPVLSRLEERFKVATDESPSKTKRIIVSAKPVARPHGIRATFGILLIAHSAFSQGIVPAWSQESDIAKQAQNPIARLISVPLENDFNPQTGVNKKDSYVLQMKPSFRSTYRRIGI